MAAQIITQSIAEFLANEDIHVFGRLSFWINIYFNKTALKDSFIETNYCTSDQFDNFITVSVLIFTELSCNYIYAKSLRALHMLLRGSL
jgi:hypothetical protein